MPKLNLFTLGNTKTMKGKKHGYLTAVLHLAPSDLSGFNVCSMASRGCRAACLNTAGRGGMFQSGFATWTPEETVKRIKEGTATNIIQKARIRRTREFFTDRGTFMLRLAADINKLLTLIQHSKEKLAIRLNGTSDLPWERIPYMNFKNIMEAYPEVQFYDYTKIPGRHNIPPNYHLTFSLSESNKDDAIRTLVTGGNVAVVFHSVPAAFMGYKVINGDDTDLRFRDPKNVIVGLTAKGKAKKDKTGFVR